MPSGIKAMKKRIFIAIHYMEVGGAEISLIGLLHALDYSKCDVDLFVYSHRGELMSQIPQEVNLLPEIQEYAQIERPILQVLKDGYWRIALARMKAKRQFRKYAKHKHPKDGAAIFQYIDNALLPYLPSLSHLGKYDLAISFLMPHGIVLNKVNARKQVAWIHTDYTRIDTNAALEGPIWNGYDHIAAISEEAAKAFLTVHPNLKNKVMVVENILSPVFVHERAEECDEKIIEQEMPRCEGETILLSVGRYTAAKNYDNVPDICKRIVEKGIPVKWYIIGFGGDEGLIRQKIAEQKMEQHVILLGKRINPYPYMQRCDIYVQPSRYEGKSVSVREAQILGKPVAITNYTTAASQVDDGRDGIIMPLDNEGCANALADFIRDKNRQDAITSYLKEHDYGNEQYARIVEEWA